MIVRGPAGLTPTLEIDIVDAAAFQRAFGVSRETMDRFAVYERLLRLWQKSINLVSASTLDEVWPRHFADSAQIVALAPVNLKTWVDIGSGGGFPGLVVALLLAHAVGTEIIQTFVPNRDGRVRDVVIDWTGVIVGVTVMRIFVRNRLIQGPVLPTG